MLRLPRGLAAATAAGVCAALAGVGCDAIVGIQDGQLVTIDSGAGVDGMAQDGSIDSSGGMDGPTGDGGGMDSTTASDSTAPVDASDGGPPPPIRCSVNPGSKTLVADLSSFLDAGSGCCSNPAQFGQALWALPLTNDNNGVEIIAQNAADQSDFSVYQVNIGQTSFTPVPAGSSSMGGVRLLDVEPSASGPFALTTVSTGSNTQALQVVSLPSTNGASPGSPTAITGTVLNNQYPNSAALLPLGGNAFDWLMAYNGNGMSQLTSGNSAGLSVTLVPSTTQSIHSGTQPFDLGGNLYTFVMGLGDAGNGGSTTVFSYPDDFSSSGTESPLVSSASLSAIIEAHLSATDSTKAALLGAAIDSSGAGSAQLWSAKLPASSLTSLTLGAPQFTAGSSLSLAELPFNQGSTVPYGDQTFIVGTGQGDATTLLLIWVDANGVALAHPAVMGPLLSTGNVVRFATIAVGQAFSELQVGLFLAWVEENGSGSSEYDQLWAAQVTCQPFTPD
jgi:hypothetical protein